MADTPTVETKKLDLYEVFTKPIAEMTDEELKESIETLRDQRKIKISASKAKSSLDILLGKIDEKNARSLLAALEAQLAKPVEPKKA